MRLYARNNLPFFMEDTDPGDLGSPGRFLKLTCPGSVSEALLRAQAHAQNQFQIHCI